MLSAAARLESRGWAAVLAKLDDCAQMVLSDHRGCYCDSAAIPLSEGLKKYSPPVVNTQRLIVRCG